MKKAVLFIACLALCGCATYHAQPIKPAELVQSFEARSLSNSALQRYVTSHSNGELNPASSNSWDLTALTLAAYYLSPDLDVARAKSGTRQAAIQTAEQRPNPSLQFPFAYTSNAKAGESPYTFGLGLDIPIETAGKRGYRVAQAEQLSNASRFNVGNVAWNVRSRLRNQLLSLYAVTYRASILEQQIAAQDAIVGMLDKRLAVGAASAPEANQSRIVLALNRLDLANTQKQTVDARAQVASAIGLPASALTNINIAFDAFERIYPEMPGEDIRRYAILNRADVLGALAEYEASQQALQLKIAGQYPDVHIGLGYTFDAGAHKFLLPVSGIALPIFNRNQGPIAEAVARRAEQAARVNALQIQAVSDADRAVQDYRLALQNLTLAESLFSAQQRRLEDLQKRFEAGETDRLALTLAQHEFYANDLARHDARVQVQQAIGQLENAMQRPLPATGLQVIPK